MGDGEWGTEITRARNVTFYTFKLRHFSGNLQRSRRGCRLKYPDGNPVFCRCDRGSVNLVDKAV